MMLNKLARPRTLTLVQKSMMQRFVFVPVIAICLVQTNLSAKQNAKKSERTKPVESLDDESSDQEIRPSLRDRLAARRSTSDRPRTSNNAPKTASARWAFGSRPFGYDDLGYPDPIFLFPYSLDPWLRGSFRAPDLHDDPYFHDRVPTNTKKAAQGHAKLELVTAASEDSTPEKVPVPSLTPISSNKKPDPKEVILSNRSKGILKVLEASSADLADNLLTYPRGKKWVKYLQPNMIPIMATNGQNEELNELLTRYDHTLVDEELRIVTTIEGFAESRKQLRRYLKSVK